MVIEQILQADRYLQVDQVGKARDVYQKVVDTDPGNAIAVVGLARCALAEGDDRQAYELASRAMRMDPENDMARRMEARLSEILATRGDPVERPGAAAVPGPQDMRPVVTDDDAVDEAADGDATPVPTVVSTPASAAPTARASTRMKERPVHRSLVDRLLGR